MKVDPFLDSVKVSRKFGWFMICFLKFCKILEPFYFFSFSSAIIASKSFLLLNWLTFNLNDISLSNSSPSCPVLIPKLYFVFTLEKIKHGRVFGSSWFPSLYLEHYFKKFVKLNLPWSVQIDGYDNWIVYIRWALPPILGYQKDRTQ